MFSATLFTLLAVLPSLVWLAEGRIDAGRDIAAGAMKWKVYGRHAGFSGIDESVRWKLRERFGVELTAVAQCVVSSELVERSKGYNSRIREEVERKHGAGVIEQVWEESYRHVGRSHPAAVWVGPVMMGVGAAYYLWELFHFLKRRWRVEA